MRKVEVNKDKELRKILSDFAELITELFDFGNKLLDCDTSDEFEWEYVPKVFLASYLDILDGISILIRESSVEPCKILLRSLLEYSYFIEYLFVDDFNQKARSYYVGEVLEKLSIYKKLMPSTDQGRQFKVDMENDDSIINTDEYSRIPNIKKAIENLETVLVNPNYNDVNKEYSRYKKENKGRKAKWYSLFDGPSNIRELARRLKRDISYEVFYRLNSSVIHGSRLTDNKIIIHEGGNPMIAPFRNPLDSQYIVQTATNISIRVFRVYVEGRKTVPIEELRLFYSSIEKRHLELLERKIIKMK